MFPFKVLRWMHARPTYSRIQKSKSIDSDVQDLRIWISDTSEVHRIDSMHYKVHLLFTNVGALLS